MIGTSTSIKVKISNILGSQIPDFIQADNPLFIEFLTQYYESEEREYGSTYLSDHISSLKKISTAADISLVEKQTVNAPNSTTPESPITLSEDLYAYDGIINVNKTTGISIILVCPIDVGFQHVNKNLRNFKDSGVYHRDQINQIK